MAKLPERMMTRSGTFYCRIWVPTNIAPIYGRQIVVRSLRTKDLKTAKSRLRGFSLPKIACTKIAQRRIRLSPAIARSVPRQLDSVLALGLVSAFSQRSKSSSSEIGMAVGAVGWELPKLGRTNSRKPAASRAG
ncbi:MAG: hypothetical protein E5X51_26365 [Mesorhizobium sp.]|uniref:DUF6538 domain-containing protein n=1 Tax=Mesorhizobium sp. TaxID=1871066 RepID=UPI0012010735|nr:DUF6538 domain-containing protein [Mesorhizobium sp.]TIQ18286.1 MAG: hypothetical protein E5X51_26365 [Mesorhizobium sp.]